MNWPVNFSLKRTRVYSMALDMVREDSRHYIIMHEIIILNA